MELLDLLSDLISWIDNYKYYILLVYAMIDSILVTLLVRNKSIETLDAYVKFHKKYGLILINLIKVSIFIWFLYDPPLLRDSIFFVLLFIYPAIAIMHIKDFYQKE